MICTDLKKSFIQMMKLLEHEMDMQKDCMKRLKNISSMFLLLMIYVSSLQDIWERVVMLNAEVSDS